MIMELNQLVEFKNQEIKSLQHELEHKMAHFTTKMQGVLSMVKSGLSYEDICAFVDVSGTTTKEQGDDMTSGDDMMVFDSEATAAAVTR